VIRLPDPSHLTPSERYALDVLVDLSRLLPVASDVVVGIEVVGEGPDGLSLTSRVADGWGITPGDGVVRIPRGTLHVVTAVAGAGAEQGTTLGDRYGRVPSTANPLVAAGLERSPIVSHAALALRRATRAAAGRRPMRLLAPWPEGRRWAVALTHDVDIVAWWPAFTAMRIAELVRHGEWRQAWRAAGAAAAALSRAPVLAGVEQVLALEAEHDLRSTWFILCGTPTLRTMAAGDLTYRPESGDARTILRRISLGNHALGLHGSFETFTNGDAFRHQRERLAGLAGRPIDGVRQHFLRLRPGDTHRAMVTAGLTYDASLGFPDRNGFRIGVADIVPQWDAGAGRPLAIDQAPVIWMDRALSKYRGEERPKAWVDDGLALADTCREVEGLWTGVWHPNLIPALGFPGAPHAFRHLLDGLLAHHPFVATLDELVTWRRRRRGARANRVSEDGTVELAGPASTHVPLEAA
jgi:hypothetical protein